MNIQANISFRQFIPSGLIIISLLWMNALNGQSPHNSNWVLGNFLWEDLGTILTFSTDTFTTTIVEKKLGMDAANVSYSDENGDLLFYSNGCTIFNTNLDTMDQAGQLNPGLHVDFWCNDFGGVAAQEQFVIPSVNKTDLYFFFYNYDDQIVEPPLSDILTNVSTKFGYAKIDMDANGGLGKVTEKNVLVLKDTIAHTGIQAVKHANGNDWWIILAKAGTNTYYKYFFADDKLTFHGAQKIGPNWPFYDKGQSATSTDGSQYIRYSPHFGISVFNFDRCDGELFNHRFIDFPNPKKLSGGMAISPNKRFIYVTNRSELFQLDLEADDIPGNAVVLGTYDGSLNPGFSDFMRSAMGNDGRIYWCGWSSKNLHVINNPDEKGIACNLVQHAIELPSVVNLGLPNIIHYELGESPEYCDFTPIIERPNSIAIKLYPNPASDFLNLENIPANCEILLFNPLGQIADRRFTSSYQKKVIIELKEKGLFFIHIKMGRRVIFNEKILVNNLRD